MCMKRHSAAQPGRFPPIRIHPAQRESGSDDWSIGTVAEIAVPRPNEAAAWTRRAAANDNGTLARVALWRRVCAMLG